MFCLGNAGGYLGLFLGYALLNVPKLVQKAFDWLHTYWNEKRNKTTRITDTTVAMTV